MRFPFRSTAATPDAQTCGLVFVVHVRCVIKAAPAFCLAFDCWTTAARAEPCGLQSCVAFLIGLTHGRGISFPLPVHLHGIVGRFQWRIRTASPWPESTPAHFYGRAMPSGILLTGRSFGALTVGRELRCDVYRCECRCGSKLTVFRSQLTKSAIRCCINCGSKSSRRSLYYGHVRYFVGRSGRRRQKASSEFLSWCAAKERCNTHTNINYDKYGGRGISVCARWLLPRGVGFQNFLADMGPRGIGLSLDRISVQGHYEKSNCRWATNETQVANQRRFLFPDGNEPPVIPMDDLADESLACG
jgi:hypothetical protein